MCQQDVFIHKDALVETTHIGEGTRVWRNVHIMPEAVIGAHCNIGEGCYIENRVVIGNGVTIKNNVAIWDNVTIEDDVFIGPAVVFTNDLKPRAFRKVGPDDLEGIYVGRGATIGANSTVVCGTSIGEYSFVGAGSVVTRDVPPYHVVYGNPAAFKGLICRCTEPIALHTSAFHCKCGLRYEISDQVVVKVF
jgi:acetyltransferase-like isoleucine patch superfamily enzyme